MNDYVISKTGEFSHTKLGNSIEESNSIVDCLIDIVNSSGKWLDHFHKQLMLDQLDMCRVSGYVPQCILLSVAMPPAADKQGNPIKFKKFENSDETLNDTVTFDIPAKYLK